MAIFLHGHVYSASLHYPMSIRTIDPVSPQAILPVSVKLTLCVISVRLLRLVGLCVRSVRKSSSLHNKSIRCATLLVKDVKSRKARTSRIKCHGRAGGSVDSVKEKPEVQEEPVPIKS